MHEDNIITVTQTYHEMASLKEHVQNPFGKIYKGMAFPSEDCKDIILCTLLRPITLSLSMLNSTNVQTHDQPSYRIV